MLRRGWQRGDGDTEDGRSEVRNGCGERGSEGVNKVRVVLQCDFPLSNFRSHLKTNPLPLPQKPVNFL